VFHEPNPAIAESQVAEATLHLKGVTLRARETARDLPHAVNLCAEDLARQVKRHRDKAPQAPRVARPRRRWRRTFGPHSDGPERARARSLVDQGASADLRPASALPAGAIPLVR